MSVNDSNRFPAGINKSFATTRWSLVHEAHSYSEASRDALEVLCESYWYPLYAFVRRKGIRVDEAQDITQAFIAELLSRESFKRANPEQGRFRSFLLGALTKFLAEWKRQALARKRGGDRRILSIDWNSAEDRYQLEPTHQLTPERIFDRRWALTVLDSAFRELRNRYLADGKGQLFAELESFITASGQGVPYAKIAERLELSEGAVKVAVHRLRRKYRERLRMEIAQTVSSDADLDEELGYLFRSLAN